MLLKLQVIIKSLLISLKALNSMVVVISITNSSGITWLQLLQVVDNYQLMVVI